jgi:hypothetical protein
MIDGPSNSTFSTGTKVKTQMLRATSIGILYERLYQICDF